MTAVPDWLKPAIHAAHVDAPEKARLELGYIPLTDCAPLVVALEKGLFGKHGLEVTLSRQVSWANIRDKVAVGVLDGAHMLAAMPIATSLGLCEVRQPTVTALSLDLNGNAITVSRALYQRMKETDPAAVAEQPMTARALARVIADDRAANRPALSIAMVSPFSTHNYLLRYWLAAAGIHPDRDVRLCVIPPSLMVDCLSAGDIDGYCVGEPWNEQAVAEGVGRTLITDYEIWNNHPEKVFGVNLDWAERYPRTHQAVLMALLEAARWIDRPENRLEVAELLAREEYVNAPVDVVKMSMTGTFQYEPGQPPQPRPDFNVFHRYAANFPWRSHAVWFVTQMVRWGQISEALDITQAAAQAYRPDLYRQAASALGLACPGADHKPEGIHDGIWRPDDDPASPALGPDRYADGRRFDPGDPVGYLRQFDIHRLRVSLDELAGCNP